MKTNFIEMKNSKKVDFSNEILSVEKLKNVYGGQVSEYTGPEATIYANGNPPTKDAEGSDKD